MENQAFVVDEINPFEEKRHAFADTAIDHLELGHVVCLQRVGVIVHVKVVIMVVDAEISKKKGV